MTAFIGIVSSKKGVGKTSITLNLAASLQSLNKEVTVVDLDFNCSGIQNLLGIEGLQPTLKEVLEKDLHIKEAAYKHPSGVEIIPANTLKYFSHEQLKEKLMSLKGSAEIVILDPNVGKGLISVLNLAEELIVVTNTDKESIKNAMKTIALAEEYGSTVLGLVVNKSEGKIDTEEVERRLLRPVLGVIPVHHKQESQNPIVYKHPKSKVAGAYLSLARQLLNKRFSQNARIA